jgi:hypothetical protein
MLRSFVQRGCRLLFKGFFWLLSPFFVLIILIYLILKDYLPLPNHDHSMCEPELEYVRRQACRDIIDYERSLRETNSKLKRK